MSPEMAVGHSGKFTATGSMDIVPGGISFHAHRATELASAELYTP